MSEQGAGSDEWALEAFFQQEGTPRVAQGVPVTQIEPSGAVVESVSPPQGMSPVASAVPAQFSVAAPIQPSAEAEVAQDSAVEDFFAPGSVFAAEEELGISEIMPDMEPLVGPPMIEPDMPVFATAAAEPAQPAVSEDASVGSLFAPGGLFAGAAVSDELTM